MAKVHILDQPKAGRVNVAVHFTTPSATNSAGIPWRDVLAKTGLLGVHGGHAGVAEEAEIVVGDVLEITVNVPDSGVADTDDRKAAIEVEADREVDEWRQRYQGRYAYYGLAFGAVS